jgi:hypothetical protein
MTALRRSTLRVVAALCTVVTVAAALAAGFGRTDAAAAALHSGSPSSSPRVTTVSRLPATSAARAGAEWLVAQLTPQGFIPTAGTQMPDYSSTAQTILALSAADVDPHAAALALSYLESNVDTYVTVDGKDGPGQLGLLILDAVALGVDPSTFGGTDLVSRLLATQQATGGDAGLFGTEQQLTDYFAGTYSQGLALVALAAAGVTGTSQVQAADAWLTGQQCPDGGWALPDMALNACNGTPAASGGPDTNSTSLAVQGLAAEGALTPTEAALASGFFTTGQDADAGWSYFPNTVATPGVSDPDSTALVIQALLALGHAPTSSPFVKGTANPVGTLLSFQLTSGSDAGAFFFPPAPAPGSIIATYEPVPALVGLPYGWGPSGNGYWEVAADGGIFSFGDAAFYGSMGGTRLNKPVVGIAATPDGTGYWEVASDGGMFSFGDAAFFGSMGGKPLNKPVVGLATPPDGRGYWEVASDGGIFSFGDARFFGSTGGMPINKPVVAMATSPDGLGYWEVASDGGIFNYGDAAFLGSTGSIILNAPVVGIAASPARPT